MGLKKYEIITVGSDKRVRALRSWQVGDRYVNIGDVGGIVYDEKTLSQDGACWLFRGNFGFPGARIGGDSIVDVGEAAPPAGGSPAVDILGSSVVAGAKLIFESEVTVADAVVLTADDFEQGTFASYVKGQKLRTVDSANYIRTKNPIFLGGKSMIVKCGVPGFIVTGIVTDVDGYVSDDERTVQTKENGALALPAGQYFNIVITKNPAAATVPADATTAQITFTGTYETKLSVIDSRVEINPATSTGVTVIRPGGAYTIASGAKYPGSVIRNSKVAINGPATANRTVRLISEFAGCNVAIDTTTGSSQGVGIHSSVKNLTFTGVVTTNWNVAARSIIQANDCDNFAVSPTIFPGLAAAQTANMPFIFQGCNVPNGKFYHHAQIANTYKNIDFALASVDLGKQVGSIAGRILASSEIEGMYRILAGVSSYGALVESYDSVKSLTLPDLTGSLSATYGTTIYKDAYFNGLFDIAGTNVFGNTKKHDTQDVSGCKIVNTGETAVNMKGNIRVEGNATLTDCSIIGSGYFGGNSIAQGLTVEGAAYMKDNAVFAPTITGTPKANILQMTDNASFTGGWSGAGTRLVMSDNARFTSATNHNTLGFVEMHDNASISGSGSAAVSGVLVLQDDASITAGAASISGNITLCGSYNQTASKTWTGKRVIDSQDAPLYDNNVKTRYDF